METNEINENIPIPEEKYEEYILKTIDKFINNKKIKIKGKILYYLEKPVFYYTYTFLSNAKNNPFDIDIEFAFEFMEGEIPYVTILTDFVDPTLNDNRNYFYCLANDYNYKFSLNDLNNHEIILESMIQGIENFLTYLNESISINAFIFFGEYEYDHIYQINDFLKNRNYLKFYRINEIIKNVEEERYVIFTKLYFLYFAPVKNDNNLVRLLFYKKLKHMDLKFNKNEKKNSLILNLLKNEKNYYIEFTLIDRTRKEYKLIDLVEDEIEENKKKDKKSEFDYSILKKNWLSYLDVIKFKNYNLVIHKYKILFINCKQNIKIKKKNKKEVEEFQKNIEFNEKLVSFYEKLNDKSYSERIHKCISNIIFMCSELVNYGNTQNEKENEYLVKIKKYITYKKK